MPFYIASGFKNEIKKTAFEQSFLFRFFGLSGVSTEQILA